MTKKKTARDTLGGAVRITRAFRPEIARERSLLGLSFTAVLCSVIFRILEPWPLKFIYDLVFHTKHHASKLVFLSNLRPEVLLAVSAVSLVAITGLAGTTEYASSVWMSLAASRILAGIRSRLFRHLASLSLSFHGRNRTGDLITHVTYDIDRMREVTVSAVLPFVTNTLTLVAMAVVMFWMNWRLGLVVLVAFPLFFLSILRLTRRIKDVARVQRSREGAIAATTAEAMGSIRTVQALSLQDKFLDVFSAENNSSLKAGNRVQQLSAGLERTVEVLAASTTAVVLWSGAHYVLDGRLTPGDLIVFVNYLRTSFKPIRQLAKYLGQMAKALASGDRVLDLLHTAPEIQDEPHSRPAQHFSGHIRFENVTFGYQPDKPVLRNVSLEVQPGQRVVVVGPSGSGKSTLASLLLRFHDPTEGRVLIDGCDIRDYTLESLRSQISIVLQDSLLFAASVRDNIGFGAVGASMNEILRAAHIANAHGFIMRMPKRYETVIGERRASLSGGQRQRIAIARAAVRKAPIIILDEPTTGLDRKNEREVSIALERLSDTRTTLLITHNLDAAQNADLVLFISDGRIVERGTHDDLLTLKGEYAALFHRQMLWNPSQEDAHVVNG
jgi:ATP-binding cassette, subfamily B, bacterial